MTTRAPTNNKKNLWMLLIVILILFFKEIKNQSENQSKYDMYVLF
jgi:hypothetical protein